MTRNDQSRGGGSPRRTTRGYMLVLYVLVALVLACSLPGRGEPTDSAPIGQPAATNSPTPPPPPTPTPQPLPPGLVEIDPPPGPGFPLRGPLTLYFNQAMDRASVENALSGQPALAGTFEWLDDTTLVFKPDAALLPDTRFDVSVNTSAQAVNGLPLPEPLNLQFHTVAPLQVVQVLPEPGLNEVNPASAVVVSFNQPVVLLGAERGNLLEAFRLEPSSQGRGEWVNTSTYIFYPEPPLAGGVEYSVHLNTELRSTTGAPVDLGAESSPITESEWSFSTAEPQLETVNVDQIQTDLPLDTSIRMTFNQPMDAESVQANFTLLHSGGAGVPGMFGWEADFTTLIYTPTQLLDRATDYSLTLLGDAQAQGGTPLGADFSTQFRTVSELSVVRTEPAQNGGTPIYRGVVVYFSGPIEVDDPLQYVTLDPPITNFREWWDGSQRAFYINGDFSPATDYTLTISPEMPDPWGGSLGGEFSLDFRTNLLDPELILTRGYNNIFLTPEETTLQLQATNLEGVNMAVGSVPFDDFVRILTPSGLDLLNQYQPADQRNWTQPLNLPGDRVYTVEVPVTPEGAGLAPGLYRLSLDAPRVPYPPTPTLLVVSNVHLTFKISPREALVWAVDLRTNQAVSEAPIAIYDANGELLASGQTDAQGVFQSEVSSATEPEGEPVGVYENFYAVLDQPGAEDFALSLSTWNLGVAAYDFGIRVDYTSPGLKTYLYTDRPIYRPGDTVYFRAVLRDAYNGRYDLPKMDTLPVSVAGEGFQKAVTLQLPLSEFGTAHGEYMLPEDAKPGYYRLENKYGSVSFQVAEYRKPEVNLEVILEPDPALAGGALTGQVEARYFFDAPAGDLPLDWTLYAQTENFYLPGYQVSVVDERWMLPPWMIFPTPLGEVVASGKGQTGPDGRLSIDLPPAKEAANRKRYTLEVTLKDESGFLVSARDDIIVHPSQFYIGVRPDTWVAQAGEEVGLEILVVDWEGTPAGARDLHAEFREVRWVREDTPNPFGFPQYVPQYTPVSSADFRTAGDGVARLAFTPPQPGTFQVEVSGQGARTQAMLWVGGPGQAVWPNLPNQRLELTPDRVSYIPGDQAEVFIPNPFGEGALAWVTVERGEVLRHEVLELETAGVAYPLSLTGEDAPNVYLSVTLIGEDSEGNPSFRVGYVNLPVEPVEQTLQVSLTSQPERAGPREEVIFEVRITDAAGNPVQGEFSLSVVDLAVLALADPNAPDILSAFYGQQPLGVRTGMALAVYTRRFLYVPGGMGGGGGEAEAFVVRQEFPDTAFWDAQIITDEQGMAQVSLTLPDSLTTWQVETQGLTRDTRVGRAEAQVVTRKELIVRPVTPHFLTVGDHVRLAAVVHNNSEADIEVQVGLRATGFVLDEGVQAAQGVSIPANGRARVEWWGRAQDVSNVDLVFSAQGGELQDAARPVGGELPVLSYTAPQTFGTAGTLSEAGERLELVSLPRTFESRGGDLSLQLAPSLAAAMIPAMEVLEHEPYACTEQTLSRFLPNLLALRALEDLGLESPNLQVRLERTLEESIKRLTSLQNEDGGWGWWSCIRGGRDESDAYITAYVLFGLSQAQGAGVFVDEALIQGAIDYLFAALPSPGMLTETWQFDRLAFEHYALVQAGAGDSGGIAALYDRRDRMNPWARAFMALSIEALMPGDERARTLFSDLERSAIRTATSAHWEEHTPSWQNMSTPVFTSGVVVYALAQYDPASPILPEAVRYLMAHRGAKGGWASTYETAWSLLALVEFMKGTGELSGDFTYSAELNGSPVISGQAGGQARLSPSSASVPLGDLYPDDPNALIIARGAGVGRLYYTAHLNVARPVEEVPTTSRGIGISRAYYAGDERLEGASAPASELVSVRLVLTLENDAYYLVLEDYIPAGAEILDTRLETSQRGGTDCTSGLEVCYDPRRPFEAGWGWWYFDEPKIYTDHISWAVDYLPAGTYELTYTLVLNQPGAYRVIPSRAWQAYFPEVRGNSAGIIFEIEE